VAAQETPVAADGASPSNAPPLADAADRPDAADPDRDPPPRLPILVDGEPVETGGDPAAPTPELREVEELETEDDRWRAAIDGRGVEKP
jgi:hypothetical protein